MLLLFQKYAKICNLEFWYFKTFNFNYEIDGDWKLKYELDLRYFVVNEFPKDGTLVPKYVELVPNMKCVFYDLSYCIWSSAFCWLKYRRRFRKFLHLFFALTKYEIFYPLPAYLYSSNPAQFKVKFNFYTGVDKSRFTVVRMEKDMEFMIITIALLTQKFVTKAQCIFVQFRKCSNFQSSLFTHSFSLIVTLKHALAQISVLTSVSWRASLMQRILSPTVCGFREKTLSLTTPLKEEVQWGEVWWSWWPFHWPSSTYPPVG
jgi:hypothetical protein